MRETHDPIVEAYQGTRYQPAEVTVTCAAAGCDWSFESQESIGGPVEAWGDAWAGHLAEVGGMKHQDPLIGTVWRRRNGRVIRITEVHLAATPLDVHRVSWEVADGSRGPGYGTMDLDTLSEHLEQVG